MTVSAHRTTLLLKYLALCLVLSYVTAAAPAQASFPGAQRAPQKRLLQTANASAATDNPNNPTGPNMRTEVDYPAKVEVLTAKLVNLIAQQTGQNTSGNYQLVDYNESNANNASGRSNTTNAVPPKKEPVQNGTMTQSNNTAAGSSTIKPAQPAPQTNATTPVRPAVPAANVSTTTPGTSRSLPPATPPPSQTTSNNSNISISSTPPASVPGLFSQSDNTSTLTLEPLLYRSQSIDDLINLDKNFEVGLGLLKTVSKDFVNNSQLVNAQTNTSTKGAVTVTIYQVTYRISNGTYVRTPIISNFSSQQISIGNSSLVPVALTKTNFTNQDVVMVDGILRNIYRNALNSADLIGAAQNQFNNSATVLFLRFNGSNGAYDSTVRNNNGMFTIMSFNKINGTSITKPNFSVIPSVYWINEQEYVTTTKAIQQFLGRRSNSTKQDLLSVVVASIPGTDRVVFCSSYMLDANFSQVCSSISLDTRVPTVDYYYIGVVPVKANSEGFAENQYVDMLGDPTFRLLDQTARSQYKNLLSGVPIIKIETKMTPTGRAYRVTYLGEKQNIQVTYTPPSA